ncbi:MAG: DNA polymerase III subunit beta [Candidatus Falkowbacteria bacterium]
MKFSSLEEHLKNGLFIVGHGTGKNQNLPILGNVLISCQRGEIKLSATNLEIGISCIVRGKVDVEGSFTVDAKILNDYITLLPNEKVDIEVLNQNLVISCANYQTKIRGLQADDFPVIPQLERVDAIKIDAQELRRSLNQVVFAVAGSETRMELSGVLLRVVDQTLVLVATDSYRLAEKKILLGMADIENSALDISAIVPAKTIQELVRILGGIKDELDGGAKQVEIYLSDNQVMFVYDSVELVSRLIEGQYPDYQQIIPQNPKTRAEVEVEQFSRAVKAAALFTKAGINDVNLDIPRSKNELVISATSGQTGENITKISAVTEGEDNFVVVNYRFLLDGINTIAVDSVVLEVVDGNTPCVLKPKNQENYLYVIMPIKQ